VPPRHPAALLVATGLALLALAPPATAGTAARFAVPNGLGTACTVSSPCSVTQAISAAPPDAQVYVNSGLGDYSIAGPLHAPNRVDIHGTPGRPRMIFTSGNGGLYLDAAGSTIENVYLEATAIQEQALGLPLGGTVRRVFVKAKGTDALACSGRDLTLENTVCWVTSGEGTALSTHADTDHSTSVARNVTLWAPGSFGYGVFVSASAGFTNSLQLFNAVVKGGSGNGHGDLRTFAYDSGATAEILTDHTRYDPATNTTAGDGTNTIVAHEANIAAMPRFVNPAAGDFHQTCLSPTVNAGADDELNGDSDFDGDDRVIGSAPDMGADEFLPLSPLTPTISAIAVAASRATVRGTVNPRRCPVTHRFEFGTTAAYGRTTPLRFVPGVAPHAASAVLTGLKEKTTYHYRLIGASLTGTGLGADRTFKTADFPGVRIVSKQGTVRDQEAKVRLACPPGTAGPCKGTLNLTRKVKGKRKKLGSASFSIPKGTTRSVVVEVADGKLSLLGEEFKSFRARARTTDAAGNPGTRTAPVKLRLPPGD
jgi:hypothetical protein